MKKFWASPWTIGIGTSFIGFLFTVIYDLVKDKSIFSTIWSIIKWIWNLIISFLNLNIKVWWLLIGIAVLFLVLFLIAKYYDFKNENENSAGFLKYTKDTIQGWSWEWNWQKDWYGKYDVENLHPVCSSCGTPLVRDEDFYGNLKCLRCNRNYNNHFPDLNHVKMIIIDNARRNLFPKSED